MKELLEAFAVLGRLGATWTTKRVSKKFLFDTIECISIVSTAKDVVRCVIEVQQWETYCRVSMEVTYYLEGRLQADGSFRHAKHPKNKTAKAFGYEGVVLSEYSPGVFGFGKGFRPTDMVPTEHRHLVGFAEKQVVAFDVAKKAEREASARATEKQRKESEEKGRRAFFG